MKSSNHTFSAKRDLQNLSYLGCSVLSDLCCHDVKAQCCMYVEMSYIVHVHVISHISYDQVVLLTGSIGLSGRDSTAPEQRDAGTTRL